MDRKLQPLAYQSLRATQIWV